MAISFDPLYLKTLNGIIRLVQIVLSIIVLICIGVATYGVKGDGFVYFVAVTTLFSALFVLIFYMLRIPENFNVALWTPFELIMSAVYTLFWFISFIICAVGSSKWQGWSGNTHSSFGAAAFFTLLATIAWGVNSFLFFRTFRSAPPPPSNTPPTAPFAGCNKKWYTEPKPKYRNQCLLHLTFCMASTQSRPAKEPKSFKLG